MRLGIVAGAASPAHPEAVGPGCAMAALAFHLAEAAACFGHEVHLFAAGGSKRPSGARLHYVPGTYGILSVDCDAKAHEWHGELLRTCDVVHDLSPTLAVIEALYLDDPAFPYLYTVQEGDEQHPRYGRRNGVRSGGNLAVDDELVSSYLELYGWVAAKQTWKEPVRCV